MKIISNLFEKKPGLRIVILYIIFGILWIYYSDSVLSYLITNQKMITLISIYKGVLFILFTSLLLFFMIEKQMKKQKLIESNLKRSENRFRTLIEKSPVAIAISRDLKFVYVNPKFISEYGIEDTSEIIGHSIMEYVTEEVSDEFADRAERRERNLYADPEYETIARRKDGAPFYVHVSVSRVELEDGPATISFIQNITPRKKAEKELKESEERFSKAFHLSPAPLVISEIKTGRFLDINEQVSRMLGYSKSEILNYTSNEIGIWNEPGIREKTVPLLQRNGYFKNIDVKLKAKNGEIHDALWSAEVINLHGTEVMLSIFYDYTDQKKIEEELKASEKKFRTLVETINDGLVMRDSAGKIIYANKRIYSIFGLDGNNSDLNKLYTIFKPEHLEQIKQESQKLTRREIEVSHIEVPARNLRGDELWLEIRIYPLFDENNSIVGFQSITRDITERVIALKEIENHRAHLEELVNERTKELEAVNKLLQEEIVKQKKAEEKVKAALEKEKELNELKSRFISIASHEFRTPLSTMYSSTELIEMMLGDLKNEKLNVQIDRIRKNIENLTEIMDDVLVISRMESGKIKFEPKEVDMHSFFTSIIEDAGILMTKRHKLNHNLNFTKRKFLLDEKLLKMAVMNLFSNAVKYSPDGGTVELNSLSEGENLIISISDSGIGIPEKDWPHLFGPFHRASNVGNIHGTGLGLSIVKRYIEMHGGKIEFQSRINKGSSFTITIPGH